jgi:excisionase family DNA binding protein
LAKAPILGPYRATRIGAFLLQTEAAVPAIERQFIRPSEAAARLGVSYQTIRQWAARGILAGQKTALGTVIDAASFERLAAARQAKAGK